MPVSSSPAPAPAKANRWSFSRLSWVPAAISVAHLFPLPSQSSDDNLAPTNRPPTPIAHLSELPNLTSDESESIFDTSTPSLLKPGERIPIYSSKDPSGAFPHAYELLLNVASRWARVTVEDLAQVVTQIDNRMATKARTDRWEQTRKDREESKARNAEKRARGEKVRGGGRGWWSVRGRGSGRGGKGKEREAVVEEYEEIDIDVDDGE